MNVRATLSTHGPALTLFIASPMIAEYLLGNIAIDLWWLLPVLAPLYGGAALLVREIAVRWHAGWRGIFLLGTAFGLWQEGLLTHSLFDPDYLGLRLLDYGYLPALGVGMWWTVFVIGLHAIWSMAAAIGLAHALWPTRAALPWLSGKGAAMVVTLLLFGTAAAMSMEERHTAGASGAQRVATGVAIAALVASAWKVGRDVPPALNSKAPPRASRVAVASFGLLSSFMLSTWTMSVVPAIACVGMMLTALGLLAVLVRRWSASAEWNARHELGLVTGALGTYMWWSLTLPATVTRSSPSIDTAGNLVLSGLAATLLLVAHRRTSKATGQSAIDH